MLLVQQGWAYFAGTTHVENQIVRKGTGFVHMGELPASDDEDEVHHVKVQECGHFLVLLLVFHRFFTFVLYFSRIST